MEAIGTDFQRARSPEHKQQRIADLMIAARRLAREEGVRSVTLTQIAGAAGVHPSGVRRYFESREEIFLRLADEGWQEWAQALRGRLDTDTGLSAQALAAALADTLGDRPLFCDLLAHAPLNLEREVSVEVVRAFKHSALAAAHDIAETMTAAFPALQYAAARDLVTTTMALAQSLWQIAHPPEALAAVYRENPHLAHSAMDFGPHLARLLHACVLGLIAIEGQ